MIMIKTTLLFLAFCVIGLAQLARGQYRPVFPKEEFAARREAFYPRISDGIAVLLGAQTRSDAFLFRQNNNFYYLSGVETPDSILILDGTTRKSYLFVPAFSLMEKTSEGPQLEPGNQAETLTGLDQVLPLDEFVSFLSGVLTDGSNRYLSKTVYLSTWAEELQSPDFSHRTFLKSQQPWDNRLTRGGYFLQWMRDRFPLLNFKSYDPVVNDMRRVKSTREIEVMRQVTHITSMGVNEAIRATEPGKYEYQLAAAADYVYINSGAQRLAYGDIAASGPNGNTWHYFSNHRQMQAGEVVLLDSGAEYHYYSADLTRTWPVSGKFSPEQEKMYRCVLEASRAVIDAIRPGITIKQLTEIYRKTLEKHGYGRYAQPFIGHYVGMATHDVGDTEAPLAPGVIFNVEPLLDIPEKHIHLRLEDTILVTSNGHENLSRESPVTIEELYRLYQDKRQRGNATR